MKTAQNYVNSEQIKTFHDGLSGHQPLTFISAAADCKFRLAVCILQTAVWKERYTMYLLLVIFIISSLSDKTDLISNFRIADLPGITDTDIPGNSAMTGKAKTAKHRREKEVKYRFYFNIPQGMLIVGATAVTASLPLQKRKDLCTTFWSLSLPRYVYIVTSSLSDKTD